MIVITTPTGRVGHSVLESLLDRGEPLRVIARDPLRLAPAAQGRVEVIVGSHRDPEVLDVALAGADALFWVVPPDPRADSPEGYYLDYARAAGAAVERHGVGRVVAITTMGHGADAGQLSGALAMDELLGDTAAAYRTIAAPFFMENILGQVEPIRERGVLALANDADRRLPVVAAADLAGLAGGLLADRTWGGVERVPVSSPDALTPTGIATTIGAALGREVRFNQITTEEYGRMLRGFGLSEGWAGGLVRMVAAQNAGFYDSELDVALGAGPTTLVDWCATVLRPAVAG